MTNKQIEAKMKKMLDKKFPDWGLQIIHCAGGFVVREFPDGDVQVFCSPEADENLIAAGKDLLWHIIEYFNINPSRHEKRRLRVVEEMGEKYCPRDNERIEQEVIYRAVDRAKPE